MQNKGQNGCLYALGRNLHWIIALFIVVLFYVIPHFFIVPTYKSLPNSGRETLIALVNVQKADNSHLSIEIVFYNDAGPTAIQTYNVSRQQWRLQGNILRYPGWLNGLGLTSGGKITQLVGTDSNTNERISVNGGEDIFYKAVYEWGWSFLLASGTNSNQVDVVEGKSFYVYMSSDGQLHNKPVA